MGDDRDDLREGRARLIASAHHVETRTWGALYNFLMANTILVLAWAQLFGTTASVVGRVGAMILLSVVGWLSSVAWCVLGARNYVHIGEFGRRLTRLDESLAPNVKVQVSAVSDCVHDLLDESYKGLRIARGFRAVTKLSYQPWIVCGTPWCFGFLHTVLTLIAVGFYPTVLVGLLVLGEAVVLAFCGWLCVLWSVMWKLSWKPEELREC